MGLVSCTEYCPEVCFACLDKSILRNVFSILDVNDGDITSPVMVLVANIIIHELVLGSVSGDTTSLHQTQAFFVKLCYYGMPFIINA